MRYWSERLYPLVMASVLGLLFFKWHHLFNDLEKLIGKLVDSSLIVSGTLLGFLLTITTIINTIETRRMRFIKDQGGYVDLMRYLRSAITLNIATVSMTIVLPFLYSVNWSQELLVYLNSIQVFLISWAWISSIRFSSIFIRLLTDK